ncbi:MAG: hypothetical protein ABJL67_16110 [Sulfitobacter sp.]
MTKQTIIDAVEELVSGVFEPPPTQERQLDNPQTDVARILEGLPLQLDDLRKEVSDPLAGFEVGDIEPRHVTSLLVLDRYVTGWSSNSEDFMVKRLSHKVLVEIGLNKGRRSATDDGFWSDLYMRHLGRLPDETGLAWWKLEVERQFVAGIEAHKGQGEVG